MVYKDITDISGRRLSLRQSSLVLRRARMQICAALTLLYMLTVDCRLFPVLIPRDRQDRLALIATMFLPGYAFIAAVFPAREDISGIVRVLLSVAFSIILVSFLGLVLDKTVWGIHLDTIDYLSHAVDCGVHACGLRPQAYAACRPAAGPGFRQASEGSQTVPLSSVRKPDRQAASPFS